MGIKEQDILGVEVNRRGPINERPDVRDKELFRLIILHVTEL